MLSPAVGVDVELLINGLWPRPKSNEFNKGVDKTSELLGEALLNAIRLAVRQEIREALIQGGFSFDDRRLDIEQASKVLQVLPDWLYRNSRKLRFTRRLGPKALRFSYQGSRLGFGGMSA